MHYEFDYVMYHIDDDASISGKEEDFETWMDDDVLQQEDPVDWQMILAIEDDETEETTELFAKLDQVI